MRRYIVAIEKDTCCEEGLDDGSLHVIRLQMINEARHIQAVIV